MKKRYGLVGSPIQYSHSPIIHRHLFKASGIDASYELIELDLGEVIERTRKLRELDGFNVTIPYKTQIIDFIDEVDPVASSLGAVNTVVNKQGRLKGYNTDVVGFLNTMQRYNIRLDAKVCILGFGGTGRMIAKTLLGYGADITIAIRDLTDEKAKAIQSQLGSDLIPVVNIKNISDKAKLLINATPVGMYPDINNSPVNKEILCNFETVFDVIYNPTVTKLLSDARELGLNCFGGDYMLIMQAIESQRIWMEVSY